MSDKPVMTHDEEARRAHEARRAIARALAAGGRVGPAMTPDDAKTALDAPVHWHDSEIRHRAEQIMIDIVASGLKELVARSHGHAKSTGWWNDLRTGEPLEPTQERVGDKLMLIVTEIAEAKEGHRKGLMDDKLPDRKMVEVELADAVIRIADLAGALGLDLGGAVVAKMKYNETREDHRIENRRAEGGKKT